MTLDLAQDNWEALRRDIAFIWNTRGPLRGQPWVRAHFENRMFALAGIAMTATEPVKNSNPTA